MWKQLRDINVSIDINVHLGDQLYGDRLFRHYVNDTLTGATPADAYRNAVANFRALYRELWTRDEIAPVLRRGENYFLPDDHDIIDNLATNWLNATKRPFIRAGRQAFLEFQYGAWDVFPIARDAVQSCAATGGASVADCAAFDASSSIELSRYVRRGAVALAAVDIRIARSFSGAHQLLDPDAMRRFENVREKHRRLCSSCF
jgi:hypothetical protein